MESIRFGNVLLCILKQVLTADSCIGTVYLSKVDLADAYMRLWVRMEDVPSAAFFIPNKTPSNTQLVGFHISVPMGYIDSAPYFCMAMETVGKISNEAIYQKEQAGKHEFYLEAEARAADDAGAPEAQADASLGDLPTEQRSAVKANVGVHLDDFIPVVQGGSRERRQMLRHLFNQIDQVFRHNEEAETNRKEVISLKKLGQGDGAWSDQKTVLGWDLDTIAHLLRLHTRQQDKVVAALADIPRKHR